LGKDPIQTLTTGVSVITTALSIYLLLKTFNIMIPGKETKVEKADSQKDKHGSFALFDIEHFLRRVLRNWYWFVLMFFIGYGISWMYSKYYAQNIYASNLSLSISNNTSSYLHPSQSINFIWGQGGNQDGFI
jgi:hypothetical protein